MDRAVVRVARLVPSIREALGEFAARELLVFDAQFLEALGLAERSFDLAPVEAVLDRWWGVAAIRANPLSRQERRLLARARVGDDSGWVVPDQDGPAAR